VIAPREIDVDLGTHRARVLEWGEAGAPLVVALHGFPDTAWTWRHLGPHLAERGFRVAAPFLRGYAPSDVPADSTFTVSALMADAAALHEALGGDERAALVGHDWGAITTNGLGAHPASPFARIVSMAVPPFPAMNPRREILGTWLRTMLRQPRNSWYIALNQVPGVSERRFEALTRKLWADWSPGYDAADDLAHLRDAVPDRDHARAVVSYYRAFLRPGRGARAYATWAETWTGMPTVPTMYLHGAQDGCLDPRFFDIATASFPPHVQGHVVPGAGHFLQLEQPQAVNELVAEFLLA